MIIHEHLRIAIGIIYVYWLFHLIFRIKLLTNIAYLCLAADSCIFFWLWFIVVKGNCHFIIIFSILIIIYKISKAGLLNHLFISFNWYIFFLPCNYSMRKLISFLKFLMMASALEGCFCLKKSLHLFEKSIRPNLA
jgi:hypothetical protein